MVANRRHHRKIEANAAIAEEVAAARMTLFDNAPGMTCNKKHRTKIEGSSHEGVFLT